MPESTQTMMIPEQEVRDALAPNYVLEIIRLRSGVGNIADVRREATKARPLISS